MAFIVSLYEHGCVAAAAPKAQQEDGLSREVFAPGNLMPDPSAAARTSAANGRHVPVDVLLPSLPFRLPLGYMRSGAATPSRRKPLAITCRTAMTIANLARLSSRFSEMTRSSLSL
jgi:hypothetical protein